MDSFQMVLPVTITILALIAGSAALMIKGKRSENVSEFSSASWLAGSVIAILFAVGLCYAKQCSASLADPSNTTLHLQGDPAPSL